MTTKVAIIPARGGSTRLKNKNILHLCGKPLIRWIVESVIDSKEFDSVYISTDSVDIFDSVKDLPVKRHHRPSHLATTESTVLSAMNDILNDIPYHDIFSYFLPTCPFLNSKYINQGMNLINKDIDSVVSVSYYDEPIQLACIKQDNDTIVPIFDNLTAGLTNSKFIQKYVKPNGGFYISHWDKFKINRNFFKGNVKGVLIPSELLVDIDYEHDLKMAEILWNEVLNTVKV